MSRTGSRKGASPRGGTAACARSHPHDVTIDTHGRELELPADRVYMMTGFAPERRSAATAGRRDRSRDRRSRARPATLETDVPGVFIAGVVVAGFDANKVFIENGRVPRRADSSRASSDSAAPAEPVLSADLDS